MSQEITDVFPYASFPIRLEFGEKKNTTVCFFQCEPHLQKYLVRSKLDKRILKIDYRDEPPKSSKTNKRSVEPKSKPKSNGGASSVRSRKPSVDTSGDVASPTKRKK